MSLSTLNTLYNVFLILTIVFFLISILLFFVFDIRRVYMIRSGRAAKRDIKRLSEENFNTGRLAKRGVSNVYNNTGSFGASEEFGKTEQVIDNESSDGMFTAVHSSTANPSNANPSTAAMNAMAAGSADVTQTTVLSSGETTVLNNGGTTVLGMGSGQVAKGRMFKIIREEMLIHTDEAI